MSDNSTTQNNAYSPFIPEIWSKKLALTLDKTGVMMQCVNRNYEGEIKSAGDTVHIRSFGDVAINTYTGSISSYSELTTNEQELIIDQSKVFAFKVNDVAKLQSDQDIVEGYIDRAKVAIELVKDSFLLSKHADVISNNTVGTDAAPIVLTAENVYGYFVELSKSLKNSNALTTSQTPWVVINPDIEAVLLKSTSFTHASALGDATLREGSIGKIAGLDVLVCTNLTGVSVDTSGYDGNRFYVMAGTNEAITFASQVVNLETIRDQNSFSDLVRGLYVYGAKTIVPKALSKLICTTTAY